MNYGNAILQFIFIIFHNQFVRFYDIMYANITGYGKQKKYIIIQYIHIFWDTAS